MTEVDDELRAHLERAREREAFGKNERGEIILPRDDDVVLSTHLCKELNQKDRPCVFSGGFWVYSPTSGAWEALRRPSVERMAMGISGMRVFMKKVDDEVVTRPVKMGAGRVKGVTDLVGTALDQEDFFHDAPQGIAFKNGFITVDKHGIHQKPKSHENRARAAFPFAYREDYECPLWMDFLMQIFRDDDDRDEKTAFIQEFIGISLLAGMTTYDKAVILYGQGANGKSVLLDVIQRLFPDESVSSIAPQQLDDQYYKARLDGVLLNVVSEMPKSDVVNTPALNSIISGDKIQARRPGENPFEFRPKAAHMYSANPPLPAVTDMARGFWRRWVIIQFNRNFEKDAIRKERVTYVDELAAEARGIVCWALKGALRVREKNGFTDVPTSDELLVEWRHQADQVSLYVKDKLVSVESVDHMMTPDDLYAAYRVWSEKTGHRPMTMTRFLDRLTGIGHAPVLDGPMLLRPLTLREAPQRPRFSTSPPEPEQDSFLD